MDLNTLVLVSLIVIILICYTYVVRYSRIALSNINTVYVSDRIPKKIWLYWNTPIRDSPKIVKICIHLFQKLNPQFECIVMNQDTYRNFVKDDRVIHILDGDYKQIYKSDLLRWYLMYEYGGIYADASILPFCSFEWIIDLMNHTNKQVCLYKNQHHTTNNLQPVYEEWLIVSEPRSRVAEIVYNNFARLLEMGVEKSYKYLRNQSTDYQNFSTHGSYHLIYFLMIHLFSTENLHKDIYGLGCNYHSYPCIYIGGRPNVGEIFYNRLSRTRCIIFASKNKFVKLTAYNREYLKTIDYPKKNTLLDYLLT
jgi:hypothetical protein